MPMRSHVDPCTFVVYIHVSGAQLSSELIEQLERAQPVQGESDRAFIDRLSPRSQQIHFHEGYHFWQGMRLPFLYRYALLTFRQTALTFRELAQFDSNYHNWGCVLPDFQRLTLEERIARSPSRPSCFVWGRELADFPSYADDQIELRPLDLLECATSIAEFQVTAHGQDLTDPKVLTRWAKRNPAYLIPYEFASRALGDARTALRCILPVINAAFHTSEPVRAFLELVGRVWAFMNNDGDLPIRFLAQPEPCRWPEMLKLWLNEFKFEAEPDCDARVSGSPYHRLTIENWVGGSYAAKGKGFLKHPFLSGRAEEFLDAEKRFAELLLLMDQPGWLKPEIIEKLRRRFSPTLSVYRFHLGARRDRVIWSGPADGGGFTSLPITSGSGWRGFVADFLTQHGAVRRASGAHFDSEQRTCHHIGCPEYETNFCNTYPVIPVDYKTCGFPARITRLIQIMKEL